MTPDIQSLRDKAKAHCYCEDCVDAEQRQDGTWHGTHSKCDWCSLIEALEKAERELDEAREALKPFAEIEVPHGASAGTWVARTTFCNIQVTAHSVRRAARALETRKSPPPLSE